MSMLNLMPLWAVLSGGAAGQRQGGGAVALRVSDQRPPLLGRQGNAQFAGSASLHDAHVSKSLDWLWRLVARQWGSVCTSIEIESVLSQLNLIGTFGVALTRIGQSRTPAKRQV